MDIWHRADVPALVCQAGEWILVPRIGLATPILLELVRQVRNGRERFADACGGGDVRGVVSAQ